MIGSAVWRPIAFDPSVEKQYTAHQLDRVVPLARLGSVIGALSFLGYGAWDLLLDPQALSKTGPIRLAVIAYFVLAYAGTYSRRIRSDARIWLTFAFSIYLVVAVGFALVLAQLPSGFVAGVSGFILGMIFVPVLVISPAQAMLILLPLVAIPSVVMYLSDATIFAVVNAVAWIGGGAGFAIGFAYLHDIINRRAFQLEQLLEIEKQRSEALLLNILPTDIAERLKASEKTIADDCESVTVLFADLVGFTELSRRLPAGELVALLNDLFSRFDRLVERLGAEKIKTIGDAYMAAAGVPRMRSDHAEAIAELGLEMLEYAKTGPLSFRLGINSGPIVAGVVGISKFQYDLWGDTVNIASRMESQGLPDEIQISAETRALLPDAYRTEGRGPIELKGHVAKQAFLLKGKQVS